MHPTNEASAPSSRLVRTRRCRFRSKFDVTKMCALFSTVVLFFLIIISRPRLSTMLPQQLFRFPSTHCIIILLFVSTVSGFVIYVLMGPHSCAVSVPADKLVYLILFFLYFSPSCHNTQVLSERFHRSFFSRFFFFVIFYVSIYIIPSELERPHSAKNNARIARRYIYAI